MKYNLTNFLFNKIIYYSYIKIKIKFRRIIVVAYILDLFPTNLIIEITFTGNYYDRFDLGLIN